MNAIKCPICDNSAENILTAYDSENINCTRCGLYSISGSLYPTVEDETYYTRVEKNKLSSWISEQNKIFNIDRATLDSGNIDLILEQKNKTILEKFNSIMKTLNSKNSLNYNDFNHCYIHSPKELTLHLSHAKELGYIEMVRTQISQNDLFNPYLIYNGLLYIENLSQTNINSKNIFCAFNFTSELKNIFDNYINQTIDSLGYTYSRVSSSSTNTNTKIDDEIISLIRSSQIVIADFSGQRNSVYFEAGFAMGLNIPVIWTCKASEWEELSFDTRQYPHILWKDEDDLAKQISDKIKAMP